MGYSFDGYNALAMSGARVDPEYHLSSCAPAAHWVEFSTSTGASLTTGTDGLWQPMTDKRIRAVIPMAPEGAMLFGERGLAAVDRPTLILVGTADTGCDYNREAVAIFKQIGTPNKALISLRNLRQNEMAWFGVYRKRSDRQQLLDPEMACVSF
jgi:predicted dienelactone hydrolase